MKASSQGHYKGLASRPSIKETKKKLVFFVVLETIVFLVLRTSIQSQLYSQIAREEKIIMNFRISLTSPFKSMIFCHIGE